MTSDEIKAMFLASAALRHCSEDNSHKPELECIVEQLTEQYRAECLTKPIEVKEDSKLSLQEAFDILVNACMSATSLELEHHPNGIPDDQIQTLAAARKMALDRVVEEVKLKS